MIDNELEKFRKFKETFNYEMKEVEDKNGILYYDNQPLIDEDGEELGEGETFINVGYKLKGNWAKLLSNLFHYEFEFKGKMLNSIEGFFQGIKFKDVEMQNYVLKYSGLDSNRIKDAANYNWKETRNIILAR